MRGNPASALSVFVSYTVPVIIRRGRIELPPFLVPVSLFLTDFQLLVVAVGDAHRRADVVDLVVVGRRHAADGRFISRELRAFPLGIDVSGRDRKSVV